MRRSKLNCGTTEVMTRVGSERQSPKKVGNNACAHKYDCENVYLPAAALFDIPVL